MTAFERRPADQVVFIDAWYWHDGGDRSSRGRIRLYGLSLLCPRDGGCPNAVYLDGHVMSEHIQWWYETNRARVPWYCNNTYIRAASGPWPYWNPGR